MPPRAPRTRRRRELELHNPFHGTTWVIRPLVSGDGRRYLMTGRSVRDARRVLCPVLGCPCLSSPSSGPGGFAITSFRWERSPSDPYWSASVREVDSAATPRA